MIISVAERLKNVEDYYFVKKLEQIALMNKEGKNVINLGIGSPDLPPSQETIIELNSVANQTKSHGYQAYRAIPEFREAVSTFYKQAYSVNLDPNSEVLPLMGSKEGIIHISLAFLNQGDAVWIPNPGYPTYSSNSKLVGAKVINYDLTLQNQWQPDLNQLEQQWNEHQPKLLWINYPHMPTGAKPDLKVMQQLVKMAKEKKFLIVHDNPYSLVLNDEAPFSFLQIEGAKEVCIELNSTSKSFNMAGWRVGMLVGRGDYLSAVLRVKSNVDSGMFLAIQKAAIKALANSNDWHDERNKIYADRRKSVLEIFDYLGCEYDLSQTGMFVWAKLPKGREDSIAFADEILEKAHVFLTPGDIFGSNGRGFLRISLCSSKENIESALFRIKEISDFSKI
ncbi:MAG: aminotransferase class I/II-fold pyridoxal phosphate-dependent enzyme [Cytophagales bacterium]